MCEQTAFTAMYYSSDLWQGRDLIGSPINPSDVIPQKSKKNFKDFFHLRGRFEGRVCFT